MASGIGGLADLGLSSLEAAVGFALGFAASEALRPLGTQLAQEAWAVDPSKVLAPGDVAAIVSQALKDPDWGRGEAAQSGIDNARFDLLHLADLKAPPTGTLIELIRRSQIDDSLLTHAFRKLQLEPEWDDKLKALAALALDPGELAKAIHRGIMVADGLLIATPSTTPGKVPIVPPSQLDPIVQAAWHGLSKEQLRILVGNAGLPPGIVQMLQLLNRGEITVDDFSRGVGESNIRNEWTDALLTLRRQLLTPHEYQEAALRGIIDNAAADAGSALHGMEPNDAKLLFQIMGRPLAVHAITTGLARGGSYGGTYDDVPEPYRDAIRRSSIRPEYSRLAYANRYTIPSYFVLRGIAQAGGLNEQELADYFKQLGWPPDLATKAAAIYAGGGTGKADAHVTKAQTQLWDTLHHSYLVGVVDDAVAEQTLATLGVSSGSAGEVIKLWQAERELPRTTLTAAQVKKAVSGKVLDPATSVPFTEQWAEQRLQALGYTLEDARILLAE